MGLIEIDRERGVLREKLIGGGVFNVYKNLRSQFKKYAMYMHTHTHTTINIKRPPLDEVSPPCLREGRGG